jgi:hypothetical protein
LLAKQRKNGRKLEKKKPKTAGFELETLRVSLRHFQLVHSFAAMRVGEY